MEKNLSTRDKVRIRETYKIAPYLSAKTIAKNLNLRWKMVYDYLVTLGYTTDKHLKVLRDAASPMSNVPTPKVVLKPTAVPMPKVEVKQAEEPKPKPAIHPNLIDRKPSPFVLEERKQRQLEKKAYELLKEAIKAGEEGRTEDYLRLRKEYEVAERQATAYKMRGKLADADKATYAAESRYSINE